MDGIDRQFSLPPLGIYGLSKRGSFSSFNGTYRNANAWHVVSNLCDKHFTPKEKADGISFVNVPPSPVPDQKESRPKTPKTPTHARNGYRHTNRQITHVPRQSVTISPRLVGRHELPVQHVDVELVDALLRADKPICMLLAHHLVTLPVITHTHTHTQPQS